MLISDKLNIWLKSVQQGFILILPVVILGSIALSLLQLPQVFEGIQPQNHLMLLASWIYSSSYSIMAILLTIGISYKLSEFYKFKYTLPYSPITNTLISLVCFIGIISIDHPDSIWTFLGVESIAKAIITAIISTELVVLYYNNKFQRFSFLQFEVNYEIHNAIRACFPAIIVPLIILTIYSSTLADINLLSCLIPFFIGEVNPEFGLSLMQSSGLIFINQIVWFFGIHPSALIEINPELIYSTLESATFSRHFLDTYAHLGGSGSTLGLIVCLLLSNNTFHKRIGLYATIPSLFNINELLIFGIPIVLNRYLILPFIIAPLVTSSIARALIETGNLTLDPSLSSWNTPIILSGYLSGGVNAALIQFILVWVSALIYWPFLKKYEASIESQKQEDRKGMIKDLCNPDLNFDNLLKRQTPLSNFCRQLQVDMKKQLGDKYFSMHYQPKVDKRKNIIGCEALIRWQHPEIGNIPPCIFINIAETDSFIHLLGNWVNKRCMQDINAMKEKNVSSLQVAINVSPIQLTDPNFFENFTAIIEQQNISFNEIELEITESQRLNLTDDIIKGIALLSSKGISIAVDDFGMGYTSLKYLNSFKVNTIKLDGIIVKDVLKSNIVKEIIRSLSTLTNSINGKLVAEWVENEEQFNQLVQLKCDQFQGAYFSMPIKREDFISLYLQQDQQNIS
jgi:lactose/cellobiose-specific phosphotransferase system IIC component